LTHDSARTTTATTTNGDAENAITENARPENAAPDCRGGKCRIGIYGTKMQLYNVNKNNRPTFPLLTSQ